MKIDENETKNWVKYFKDEYQSYLNQIKKVNFIYDRNQPINMQSLLKPLENVTYLEVNDQRDQKQASAICTFFTGLDEVEAHRITEFHYTSQVYDDKHNSLLENFKNLENLYLKPDTFLSIPNINHWPKLRYLYLQT